MSFNINDRRLIEGPTNDLMQIRPVKHSWAMNILEQMKDNTWDEREIDLSEDAKQYATGALNGGNLTAYKKALAFLSNLDGIQFNNLTMNIGRFITSPEVSMCISRQAWEEALHVISYAQMIESIGFDPEEIYWMFETDPILAEKNQYIMSSSEILGKEYSAENFVKAVAANIALEGIYFFNGFLTFYVLERQGLMKGSAKMIKLIQRDEAGPHLHLFIKIWHTLREERPELFTSKLIQDVRTIISNAVEHEVIWGQYIISEGVLGLTNSIVDGFVKNIADQRLKSMGLELMYGVKNPITWFDEASHINDTEENSFETKISAYQTGALEW